MIFDTRDSGELRDPGQCHAECHVTLVTMFTVSSHIREHRPHHREGNEQGEDHLEIVLSNVRFLIIISICDPPPPSLVTGVTRILSRQHSPRHVSRSGRVTHLIRAERFEIKIHSDQREVSC